MAEEDLKRLIEKTAEETRRHFDVFAERLEKDIQLLDERVSIVNEKVDRTARTLQDDMNRGFAETQAMIKFSHSELDKRIRTLEGTVADHQTRLERLEGTNRPS